MEKQLKHEGLHYRVYYLSVDSFEEDLPDLGRHLEQLTSTGEEIVSVVTNTGWVNSSFLLGSSFQGVKGFALITRKKA